MYVDQDNIESVEEVELCEIRKTDSQKTEGLDDDSTTVMYMTKL